MAAKKKNRVGRPTTFGQAFVDRTAPKLPDMFAEGQSVAEVCVALDMSKDTFYRLVEKYPQFSDAYKKGLDKSEAWWAKLGRGGSAGLVKINPATWIFNMKNRFNWTDRNETKHGLADDAIGQLSELMDELAS